MSNVINSFEYGSNSFDINGPLIENLTSIEVFILTIIAALFILLISILYISLIIFGDYVIEKYNIDNKY